MIYNLRLIELKETRFLNCWEIFFKLTNIPIWIDLNLSTSCWLQSSPLHPPQLYCTKPTHYVVVAHVAIRFGSPQRSFSYSWMVVWNRKEPSDLYKLQGTFNYRYPLVTEAKVSPTCPSQGFGARLWMWAMMIKPVDNDGNPFNQ